MENISFEWFLKKLAGELKKPLPGWEAQISMTSRRSDQVRDHINIPFDAKPAAVLITLFPADDDIGIIFMKRPEYDGVHSGQISFPGGKQESDDSSLEETAMRETEEELGIHRQEMFLIGRLTDLYIPPSNFLVTPVAGHVLARPEYNPDPNEVEKVIEIHLTDLLNLKNQLYKEVSVNDYTKFNVPCYQIGQHTIWGATAMILSEFLEIIRRIIPNTRT